MTDLPPKPRKTGEEPEYRPPTLDEAEALDVHHARTRHQRMSEEAGAYVDLEQSYRDAGAPHGDTVEGLMQWVAEAFRKTRDLPPDAAAPPRE
jgi:hypothetical protein